MEEEELTFTDEFGETTDEEIERLKNELRLALKKEAQRMARKHGGMSRQDRARAKALLVDIATWNPERYQELMKNGEEAALKELLPLLEANRNHAHEMKQAILEQMGEAETPEEAAGNEWAARMIAQEMAQEAISNLY